MNHKVLYAIMTIMSLFVVILSMLLLKTKNEFDIYYNYANKCQGIIDENYFMKDLIATFYKNNNTIKENESGLTECGAVTSLYNILLESNLGYKIILEAGSADCSICIDSALNILSRSNLKENLIVMSSFKTLASAKFLKKTLDLQNTVFLNIVPNQYKSKEHPVVYILDKEKNITDIFIIDYNHLDFFKVYLNHISEKYYKSINLILSK